MRSLVLLAGGKSSRMACDKALLPFKGEPLIRRILNRVYGIADEMIVVTNTPDSYITVGVRVVTDVLPERSSMSGLLTAMSVATYEHVAVVGCDMPFVNAQLLTACFELLENSSADAVVPRTEQGYEPLHAVYRRETCLPMLQQAIKSSSRRLGHWLRSMNVRDMTMNEISQFGPSEIIFFNVNTPEEFEQAEILANASES